MFISLFLIGGIGQIGTTSADWASAIMLLCWSVAYQFSVSRVLCRYSQSDGVTRQVGTVCYSLVAELSSRRLLIKSIALGRGVSHVTLATPQVLIHCLALLHRRYRHRHNHAVHAEPHRMELEGANRLIVLSQSD